MPIFVIVLATVLLTVAAQELAKFIMDSFRKNAIAALSVLCKVAFNEDCFVMYMNRFDEECFVVNLCESKKYIIFNSETIRNMPKDTVKNIEYIRNLPLADKL